MEFPKPINLNGIELKNELINAGCQLNDEPENIKVIGDRLFINVVGDENVIATIIENHNGTIVAPEPSIENKLSSVGLNLDDLKVALGIS